MPMPTIVSLTQLVIGFSVFSAAILLTAYLFFIKDMRKSVISMVACSCLLAALTALQFWHWYFLQTGLDLFTSRPYVLLLLVTPPAFYFFSREILLPDSTLTVSDGIHVLPLSLGLVMPTMLVIPVALTIGVGYSIWLVRVVFGMRREVRRFKFEIFFFGFFALLAALVLFLGVASPQLEPAVFFFAYANMTGLALIMIVGALIAFPDLLNDISAAAELSYAASTLNNVEVDQKLQDLDRLMLKDKIFQNESLNLNLLASAVDLSPHQLSELINTKFGFGFSHYIREQRVAEAKRLLESDATSSILSISLMTGFKSQSNFYTAFRQMTGESPGEYRRKYENQD